MARTRDSEPGTWNLILSSTQPAMLADFRYAIRGLRRSPLFAASVTATIGLGLGVLCSGFTLLNAYVLTPIDVPNPHELYALSWDTTTVRRQRIRMADFEALRDNTPHFSGLAAATETTVMQDGVPMNGLLVTGDFFPILRVQTLMGRTLIPADAAARGLGSVVVLSHAAWRSRYGSDPAIVGKAIVLAQQRFDVVGVLPRNFAIPGLETISFYAPLTMAGAFSVADPWSESSPPSLLTLGRLKSDATEPQVRAWFEVWLRQRFPVGSEFASTAVRVEPRGKRLPLDGVLLTLFLLILSAFGLVLLVACANVTNLVLARGFGRQREIAVRLSLGAHRGRVIRQLVVESLVLAVPAAAVGLALTMVFARVFPALIAETFPLQTVSLESILLPLDPDLRVIGMLAFAAIASAVFVSLMPALHVTRANLARAAKGDEALDTRRSRLRTALVAMQIGASLLFLVSAVGFINQTRRLATPVTDLSYEQVSDVRVPPQIRADVAARLAADPAVEQVGATWRPPLAGPLPTLDIVASGARIAQAVGYMVVSPEYFPMLGIRMLRGRAFTTREADESAPLAMVSQATARTLWPGLDPIGQTLEVLPPRVQGRPSSRGPGRRPTYTNVRVIGVVQDVASGVFQDGVDPTCVYFATGLGAPGEVALLVRARGDLAAAKAATTAAVNAVQKDAPFRFFPIVEMIGGQVWVFKAFSVAASVLGIIGLLLAFSGTYAVVAFLVTQRTREFGIRMALGASVRQIVAGMMNETLYTAAIGMICGAAVAIPLTLVLNRAIFLVPPLALAPYVVGVSIVLIATATAALVPSLRAARIDPSKALRVE